MFPIEYSYCVTIYESYDERDKTRIFLENKKKKAGYVWLIYKGPQNQASENWDAETAHWTNFIMLTMNFES